jgi:DNA repair protein SbcC/Rad50
MFIGSDWNKWDLHVHTPDSIVHDYRFTDQEKKWDEYISELEKLPENIKVLGINDYWFINGYKKVLEYKENGRLENIELILPVIEVRLKEFVGSKQLNKINYHIIFSNKLTATEIETHFLNRIDIKANLSGTELAFGHLCPDNFEQLGKEIEKTTPEEKKQGLPSHKELGFNNFTIDLNKLDELLKNDFLKGKYLRIIGKSEWDDFRWESSASDKKSIINNCDFVFSASPTIENAIKSKESLINQGVNSRLLHCSDSHEFYNGTFTSKVLGHCFSWLKAECTFEGLKQVLYESDSRIYLGENTPPKAVHKLDKVIIDFDDDISIGNEKFCFSGKHEISFSPYFSCIIGGRGSGKSTLVNLIAEKNGQKQDSLKQLKSNQSIIEAISFEPLSLSNLEYIPQNRIEDFAKDSPKFTLSIFERLNRESNYELINIEKELEKELEKLDNQIILLDDRDVLLTKLDELKSDIQTKEELVKAFSDMEYLNNKEKVTRISKDIEIVNSSKTHYNNLLETLKNILDENEEKIVQNKYDEKYNLLFTKIESLVNIFSVNTFYNEVKDYEKLLKNQQEVAESIKTFLKSKNLSDENIKDVTNANIDIEKLKSDKNNIEVELLKVIKQIEEYKYDNLNNLKESFSLKINEQLIQVNEKFLSIKESNPDDIKEIKIEYIVSTEIKEQLINKLNTSLGLNYSSKSTFYDYLFKISFENILLIEDNKKFLEDLSNNCNTNAKAFQELESIFINKKAFEIYKLCIKYCQYDFKTNKVLKVLYDNKSLEDSSFGQRCTAAIVILLSLGNNPIILDEPEAHLDSSLIANYLVKLIKEQKKNRQIIFATHNANFVINADADLIIKLSNEDGITSSNSFTIENLEYRNSLLNLEGGLDAFEKREKKYNIRKI